MCTVIAKGERPLRYETTRPISAKVSSSSTKHNAVHTKPPRAKSATTRTTSYPTKLQNGPSLLVNNAEALAHQGQRSYVATFVTEEQEKQDSVAVFSQDMRQMQNMEDDFKRTAKMLQSKLGISGGGTI